MKFKNICLFLLCFVIIFSSNFMNLQAKASDVVVGIDFEQNSDCNFYNTDSGFFSTTYKDSGRSAGIQAKNTSQLEAYFDTGMSSQYQNAQAIVFWLKVPSYNNSSGDLPNLNIGLICGDTRWKLNQNPIAGMGVTFIWDSNHYAQKIPLVSQGGGVYLDAPSGFEGYVVVPLDILVKDWGTASAINVTGSTAFNIVWEWLPTTEINKVYYIDSIGFTKDINKYLYNMGISADTNNPMDIGIDYETDQDCSFNNIDSSSFSLTYKDSGRSACFTTKDGSQINSYFDNNVTAKYKDAQMIALWLKTPAYANPSGDLPNLNIGLICGDTRWKLNQNPTSGMAITYIWTATNQVQTVPLVSQGGGVYLDAPSDFEGWVLIPLNTLVKDWGTASTLNPTNVTAFNIIWEWLPTADIDKTYYLDSVGLVNSADAFKASLGIPDKNNVPKVNGITFENNSDCMFINTDSGNFSTNFMEAGRSAAIQTRNSSQIEAYFDLSINAQYTNAQALMFWLKTPEYANPSGDLPNLNIGLICGDTRWKLNQNPTPGMAVTYISNVSDQVLTVPLVSQGGGVYLDAPSNFEGWVVVPLNNLVKDWGTASALNPAAATAFNIVWEWLPTDDIGKTYYIDNVGFTKYVTGTDFEQDSDCTYSNTDVTLFSNTYKSTGRSIGLAAKNSTQIISNIDTGISGQYTGAQAIAFWMKTPAYSDPAGDLANINIGLICGDTRWKLNQNPTAGMTITYVWSKNKRIQNVAMQSQGGGVFLDAPSNFEGWVIIPTAVLVKDWGPASSINLSGATAVNMIWEWVPTNDIGKMYYLDDISFTKDMNGFMRNMGVSVDNRYILNEDVWRTPSINPNGFTFEVQTLDYSPYDQSTVRNSINALKLGESQKISNNVSAEEWDNNFHFITNVFGSTPPTSRTDALNKIFSFLNSNYIQNKSHIWKSVTGHFEYQHYAAEAGFDILGTEIGEVVNSYQMHIAFNRGAAKQYGKPWFIDFSPWLDNGILDYSGANIWGTSSGDKKGHSISLTERSYYMSYMSGASWLIAEAGGINFFYPTTDTNGYYKLTPLGKMGQKFNSFTKANPDIGLTYSPFGILLDYYHGTYYGSDYPKKSFMYFNYNNGDNFTWELLDKFFPDSWKAWNREELGTLTNSPYGDSCDILLQNASQEVLNSYPVIILSGDLKLNSDEIARIKRYVWQGGKLVINSAYINYFPEFYLQGGGNRYDVTYGNGTAMVFGPDYDTTQLDTILSSLTTQLMPFAVSGGVEYLVNIKNGSMIVTVINNQGVTKPDNGDPIVDQTKTQTVNVNYRGIGSVRWVKDLRTGNALSTNSSQSVILGPGDFAILEFGINN